KDEETAVRGQAYGDTVVVDLPSAADGSSRRGVLAHEWGHVASWSKDLQGQYLLPIDSWHAIAKAAGFLYVVGPSGRMESVDAFFDQLSNRSEDSAFAALIRINVWIAQRPSEQGAMEFVTYVRK